MTSGSKVIGTLASVAYKSLFLRGEDAVRKSHLSSKLLLLTAMVYAVKDGVPGALAVVGVSALISLLAGASHQYLASVTLSAVPAAWLAASALALSPLIGDELPAHEFAQIFLRSLALSLAIVQFVSSLSPVELSKLLRRVSPKASMYPLLVWKLVPASLKDFTEALAIQSLKGDGSRRAIAVALASQLERGSRVYEANYYRLEVGLVCDVDRATNGAMSALLALIASSLLVACKYVL